MSSPKPDEKFDLAKFACRIVAFVRFSAIERTSKKASFTETHCLYISIVNNG